MGGMVDRLRFLLLAIICSDCLHVTRWGGVHRQTDGRSDCYLSGGIHRHRGRQMGRGAAPGTAGRQPAPDRCGDLVRARRQRSAGVILRLCAAVAGPSGLAAPRRSGGRRRAHHDRDVGGPDRRLVCRPRAAHVGGGIPAGERSDYHRPEGPGASSREEKLGQCRCPVHSGRGHLRHGLQRHADPGGSLGPGRPAAVERQLDRRQSHRAPAFRGPPSGGGSSHGAAQQSEGYHQEGRGGAGRTGARSRPDL